MHASGHAKRTTVATTTRNGTSQKLPKTGDRHEAEHRIGRVLREELPDAHLMFDNHSIRYYDDVDYSVQLCKAVAQYKPFWIEEPICPEHWTDTRIKEESA